MFQEMINGSIAVLTKPSVSTFEEHERDNLSWALIYSVIAGVINAIITGIRTALFPAALPQGLEGLEGFEGAAATGTSSIIGAVFGAIIFTIIGLLIAWGITFALGRAFGGTGTFGELAYDLALFSAPTTVIGSIFGLIPILGGIAALALFFYNLYLAIQAGMNLPSNKALYVILIQFAIGLAIFACIFIFFAAIFAAVLGGSGNFAP